MSRCPELVYGELVVSPIYSKDFGKLGKSYAKMLVNQLKKDKVIKKK